MIAPVTAPLDMRPASPPAAAEGTPLTAVKVRADGLSFYYGKTRALDGISLDIRANLVTAFIGPSGCGKSTYLRTLNRMNDIVPGARVVGTVELDGQNIYAPGTDVVGLRRRV